MKNMKWLILLPPMKNIKLDSTYVYKKYPTWGGGAPQGTRKLVYQ
jgi:hypothetical protein